MWPAVIKKLPSGVSIATIGASRTGSNTRARRTPGMTTKSNSSSTPGANRNVPSNRAEQLGRILQVRVDLDRGVAPGVQIICQNRELKAEISGEANDPDSVVDTCFLRQPLEGGVGARIVGKEELEIVTWMRLGYRTQTFQKRFDILCFIQDRYRNRNQPFRICHVPSPPLE